APCTQHPCRPGPTLQKFRSRENPKSDSRNPNCQGSKRLGFGLPIDGSELLSNFRYRRSNFGAANGAPGGANNPSRAAAGPSPGEVGSRGPLVGVHRPGPAVLPSPPAGPRTLLPTESVVGLGSWRFPKLLVEPFDAPGPQGAGAPVGAPEPLADFLEG